MKLMQKQNRKPCAGGVVVLVEIAAGFIRFPAVFVFVSFVELKPYLN